MKKIITILVGFIHDFAAGCWAATMLAAYWLHKLSFERPELRAALQELKREFFYLSLACVVVVLIAGAGRTFTYIGNIYGEDAERIRRKMLIVKHVILFTVFGIGIYWQYLMAYTQ